jgi:hypothetical protein
MALEGELDVKTMSENDCWSMISSAEKSGVSPARAMTCRRSSPAVS